jgi:hypothetical protein
LLKSEVLGFLALGGFDTRHEDRDEFVAFLDHVCHVVKFIFTSTISNHQSLIINRMGREIDECRIAIADC